MTATAKEKKQEYIVVAVRFANEEPLLKRLDLACAETSRARTDIVRDALFEWLETRQFGTKEKSND